MLTLVLNGDAWLLFAVTISAAAVIIFTIRHRQVSAPTGTKVASGFNLFFGTFMAIMGTGHTGAVITKLGLGILPPRVNLWYVIPLGFAMAVPAGLLIATAGGLRRADRSSRNRAMLLNGWLAVVLLVPADAAPLAGLAALNILLARIGAR